VYTGSPAAGLDPSLQHTARKLSRQLTADSVDKALTNRPSVGELVADGVMRGVWNTAIVVWEAWPTGLLTVLVARGQRTCRAWPPACRVWPRRSTTTSTRRPSSTRSGAGGLTSRDGPQDVDTAR
jgi:hypothetical protein